MNISTIIHVINNNKSIQKRNEFECFYSNLTDGVYLLIIEQIISKKTRNQEKAWWGVLIDKFIRPTLNQLSGFEYTKDQVFEIIKKECLPDAYKEKLITDYKNMAYKLTIEGKEKLIPEFRLTTTKLTKIEAVEFIDNIYSFSKEYLNTELPKLTKNE